MRRLNFLGLSISAVFVLSICIWVPEWWAGKLGYERSNREFPERSDVYRKTISQWVGGFGVAIGLYFAFKNLKILEDGKFTYRFSKAVDQLGAKDEGCSSEAIRVGGIHARRRLALDSTS